VTLRCYGVRIVAPVLLVLAGLVVACDGKTIGGSVGSGEDSRTGATDSDAGCVDLEVFPPDLSCGSDQDCELVRTGEVCSGQCSCGDTPVNAAAGARFQSEIASLTLEGCPCAFQGEPRCLGSQCTLCGLGPDQPAGCGDSETTTIGDGGSDATYAKLPMDGSSTCVLSDNDWYCPGNAPYPQCPDSGTGPCDYDGGTCFACDIDGIAGSTCGCVHDTSGNFSGEDGGESDAPLTWNCEPAEFGCSQ
jgi:hypothetical protein